jgi:hypothetical protein
MQLRAAVFWDITQPSVVFCTDVSRQPIVLSSRVKKSKKFTLENGKYMLSRNVGIELPLNSAEYLRRAQISCRFTCRINVPLIRAALWKPEMKKHLVLCNIRTLYKDIMLLWNTEGACNNSN